MKNHLKYIKFSINYLEKLYDQVNQETKENKKPKNHLKHRHKKELVLTKKKKHHQTKPKNHLKNKHRKELVLKKKE